MSNPTVADSQPRCPTSLDGIAMGRKRGKARKQKKRGHSQQRPSPQTHPPVPQAKEGRVGVMWKSIGGAIITLVSLILGAYAFYPRLAVNVDYTFDYSNPYNTSFSVENEGYLTPYDLTAVCISDFAYDGLGSMPPLPLTTTTDSRSFASSLSYKHRASIPCNHNIIANGHPLLPGATQAITISYRVLGLKRSQTFRFYLVKWWNNAYRWEYKD